MAKRTYSQRPNWHRHFHGDVLREQMPLTLAARGLLCGLKDLMFSFSGPVKNDLAWIGKMLGIRDKRTVAKALQELIDLGYIQATDEGLIHQNTMRELDDNSALFAAHGLTGGRPAKNGDDEQFEDSSRSDRDLMPNCSQTDPSQVIENVTNLKKPDDTKEQSQNQNHPHSPQASPANGVNGHVNGGGGGVEQAVIEEYYSIVGSLWGDDAMREARVDTYNNRTYAGQWLKQAGGSFSLVQEAMQIALDKRFHKRDTIPARLAACCDSVPGHIAKLDVPSTLTTKSKNFAAKAAGGEDPLFIQAMKIADDNEWYEIYDEIHALSKTDTAAANELAKQVWDQIKSKKARAA